MSSNIGPEAQAAYQKYLDSNTIDEKIKNLENYISLVPKHKATEKTVALNKSRLAKLKREQESQKQRLKSAGKKASPFSIKKEGIQIIFISDHYTPGVGKTALLNYLTGAAKEKIGKFTSLPEIGGYRFKKMRFQIVDMPAIMDGASTGVGNGKEILSQIRSTDLLCLLIDLSRNIKEQMDLLLSELEKADIRINTPPPPITIEKTGANKVQVFYLTEESKDIKDLEKFTEKLKEVVQVNGLRNAIVKIYGKITLEEVVDALTTAIVYKHAIIIGTKGDLPNTGEVFNKELKDKYSEKFPLIIGSSVNKKEFPDNFGDLILKVLDKVKIYTMNAGIVAEKPLIIDSDSAIKDVALKIHRSFFELFDYAVVIRKGARQKRKRVGLDYKIKDNDIIELHTI